MKRPLLIIALAVLFSLRATAQQTDYTATDSVLAYIKHAMLFNRSMPQEKAYLHLDNTGYFKGERIWFKAYLRRADTGEPSDISKVLYVELLNPSGDVIQKAKLKVENGEAAGDLGLDSIFGSGFYEIRAYTRYMMNFGDATAFSRVLPVFNKPKTEGDYSNPVIDQYSYRNRLPGREKEEDAAVLSAEDGKLSVADFGSTDVEILVEDVLLGYLNRQKSFAFQHGRCAVRSGGVDTALFLLAELIHCCVLISSHS